MRFSIQTPIRDETTDFTDDTDWRRKSQGLCRENFFVPVKFLLLSAVTSSASVICEIRANSPRRISGMCLAPVIRPDGPAPKGQESLAQGLPWVSRYKRFALKGLEMRTRSGAKVRSRFSPYLVAPPGLIRVGGITQGKPWAMLSWPLRAV
jgi:hypothetical protein